MKKWIAFGLVLVLVIGIFVGCGEKAGSMKVYDEESLDAAVSLLAARNVLDLSADDPRLDQVIAKCGDYELTNRGLQFFFWMEYLNFLSSISGYGVDPSAFGMDVSKPLSEQQSMTEGMTWEQYFLSAALKSFRLSAISGSKAKSENFEMPTELSGYLETLNESLESQAVNYGFADATSFVQDSFGPGATVEGYADYIKLYYYGSFYENGIYEKLEYTDEELETYYNENKQSLLDSGVTKDDDISTVNVRHILITWEDADGDGTPTDEEKLAAQDAAESLLTEYQKNPTEDNFAALAAEHSTDPGSKSNGGLYEGVYPGQMVTNFNDWCFDKSRQSGDTGIVETNYGYHVMYFVSKGDTPYWKSYILDHGFLTEKMDKQIEEWAADYPFSANLEKIVLGVPAMYGQ